jgi:hypothetical protein
MVLLVVGFLAFGHDLVFQPQTPSKNSRGPAAPQGPKPIKET